MVQSSSVRTDLTRNLSICPSPDPPWVTNLQIHQHFLRLCAIKLLNLKPIDFHCFCHSKVSLRPCVEWIFIKIVICVADLQIIWSGKLICKSDEIWHHAAIFWVCCTTSLIPRCSPSISGGHLSGKQNIEYFLQLICGLVVFTNAKLISSCLNIYYFLLWVISAIMEQFTRHHLCSPVKPSM